MLGAFNFGSELLPRRAGLRSHRLVFAALTLLQRELTEIDGGPYDGVVGRGAPPRAVVRQWKAASRRRYPLLLLPERVTPGCMSSLVEGSASASVASLLRNGAAASSQRLPARIVRLKVSDGWFAAGPLLDGNRIEADVALRSLSQTSRLLKAVRDPPAAVSRPGNEQDGCSIGF